MKAGASIFSTVFERLISGMNATATIWIFVLVILVVLDVAGRIFFKAPLTGTTELCKISNPAICFLQIAYVLRMGSHIRTTMVYDRLSSKGKKAMDIFSTGLGLLMFGSIVYASLSLTWVAWALGEYEGEGALRVPTAPVRTIIILGSICMIIQFLRNLFGYQKEDGNKVEPTF
jgi:TRAP-type C4-dicarboxylate transport system permease small subunit